MKRIVVGDGGMSFLPFLSMFSSGMGGGAKDTAKPADNSMMQMMLVQQQKKIAEQEAAAKRTQTYIFAGVGVAALGTVLYLIFKR